MITPGNEKWVKNQNGTLAEYGKKPFQFAFASIMLTEYPDELRRIAAAIHLSSSRLVLLNGCKDIWARDYMPFQRHDGKYLMYKYAPDYLKPKEDRQYRSNPKDVSLGSKTLKDWLGDDLFETDLVIDGGNLIKCYDSNYKAFVIATEKVLYENPTKLHRDVIMELEYAVNADVILIPWDKEEPFGHADGMVRYIRPGELLLNCYDDMDEKLAYQLRLALGNRFKLHMLKYGKSFQQDSWCHINYIETDDDVLIPAVGIETDALALKQLEKITAKRGHLIKMDKIVKQGGALHCISWELRHTIPVDTNIKL